MTAKTKRKRPNRNRRLYIGVASAVAFGLIVWLAWDIAQPDAPPPEELAAVQTFDDLGTEHNDTNTPVSYNSDPPTSGPHSSTPAACGIYRQPIPDGNMLHSMEHGAVVIQYDPSLPSDQVAILEAAGREIGRDVIVAPRPGNPAPVALTAWTKLLLQEQASKDVVLGFARQFGNRSPEAGAICAFQVDEAG